MKMYGEYTTSLVRALEEIDQKWESYPGLIIAGTHNPDMFKIDALVKEISVARDKGLPYLGICFGHQLAVIEYARNVAGIKDATSEEFGEKGTFVIKKREKINVGLKDGQSYWNNYDVNLLWEKPRHFFTTQYHPEYQSAKDNHHPLLVDFLNYAKKVEV